VRGDDRADSRRALEVLANVVGIEIPSEDFDLLARALEKQFGELRTLDEAPVAQYEPITWFDPRWP